MEAQRSRDMNQPRAGRHSAAANRTGESASPWLSLTDLGRLYGISAVHCGRLLDNAGLRESSGQPSPQAIAMGIASPAADHRPQASHQIRWHREGCRPALEATGLARIQQASLVQQWAALLSALNEGSPSISTSAAQMAEDLPGNLVEPVNAELRQLGCTFQVHRQGRPNPHSPQSKRRRVERGSERPAC